MSKKIKGIYFGFITCLLLMQIACSATSKNWSYTFEGTSENWKGILKIRPTENKLLNEENIYVVFIGSLEKQTDKPIEWIKYNTTTTTTSEQSGVIDTPTFDKENQVDLFLSVPSNDRMIIKAGMPAEEIKGIFPNVIFKINWKDNTGEHREEMKLTLREND
ncbi:hypothetical protein JQN58_12325 [Aneurinibacillus sp. BA2021]|nr:hypothetical protein [Aneurinibacillus sp. BA2021]